MKMLKNSIFFILLLSLNYLKAKKSPNDVCLNKSKCGGDFPINCNEKYCMKDEKTCKDMKNVNISYVFQNRWLALPTIRACDF